MDRYRQVSFRIRDFRDSQVPFGGHPAAIANRGGQWRVIIGQAAEALPRVGDFSVIWIASGLRRFAQNPQLAGGPCAYRKFSIIISS
jgi:hypothetical protein